ncbi:MAG: serine/threonine protein kinase [bacterium]|nr:serine/threonine protein kinase [bacterium]
MSDEERVRELFARFVEHHVLHGERLDAELLCRDAPQLLDGLRICIRRYDSLEETLRPVDSGPAPRPQEELPRFEGFRTVECLGSGGEGAVYKLEDLELGRSVAAKVVRDDALLRPTINEFLGEARTLALFEDPRIVTIYEFRARADPPVLLMEYVDGFELGRVGKSLEYRQRARLMADVADAIQHAHELGIQHRDLKPANVIVDSALAPRILDFGLSGGDRTTGHGVGTPSYMAPEQFEPARPIDERTDVYALGVMLYELLCGSRPFRGETTAELTRAIREAAPRLPVEVEPSVPEPLQAIALKAMERDPQRRYASARELAQELRRFLDERPVLARPTVYRSALRRRSQPHLEQIREWLRIKLIYPHEAERLGAAYRRLEAREDDWIVGSRVLSMPQVVLYLGAFLLGCGGLLYFVAFANDGVDGLIGPVLVLGLPFVGLDLAARALYRREHQAVAVAFFLAGAALLPLLLLVSLQQAGIAVADPDDARQLFGGSVASNRQLQVALLLSTAWTFGLASTTRTVALSSGFALLGTLGWVAVVTDFDLVSWIFDEPRRLDLLALYLVPAPVLSAVGAFAAERRERPWLATPLYFAASALFVVVLELLALDGRAFGYLGISLAALQEPSRVADPELLNTLAAMVLNGVLIYVAGRLLEIRGSELARAPARLLVVVSPFAVLQPLFYLNHVGEYSLRFLWLYLALSLVVALLSHFRQRKSFYYAGLTNTACALLFVTDRYDWYDRPSWSVAVVLVGICLLGAGLALHRRDRRRRRERD